MSDTFSVQGDPLQKWGGHSKRLKGNSKSGFARDVHVLGRLWNIALETLFLKRELTRL